MLKTMLLAATLAGCAIDQGTDEAPPPTSSPIPTPIARGTAVTKDTLEEYAAKCDAATGIHVPSFNCDLGDALSGQTQNAQGKCATPNVLYGECDPGARFQVVAQNAEATAVAHCRKHGATTASGYRDIAVIQYNKVNGAVCFYQALPDTMDPSDLPGANVRAPSEGMAAWRWENPEETRGGGCTGCHDNGAFIRSPYLAQLTSGPHALPSIAQGYDNNTTPLKYVGLDFAGAKSWSVTRTGETTCTGCHRLAANTYGPIGTAAEYARVATAEHQNSKYDHGNPAIDPTKSPIWMLKGQMDFSQATFDAAIRMEDCAKGFVNGGYGSAPAGCSVTPLGEAYSPAITGSYGDDIVSVGSGLEGAGIVTMFSHPDGSWGVTNTTAKDFGALAKGATVKRVSGDFNKDGRMDFALVGGIGWNTLPTAMSNGDGTYLYTNAYVGLDFNNWARTANVKALVGDYNKDGFADIALTGAAGWASIPVAFSAGYGNFQITNYSSGLAGFASQAGAQPIVGDYNKDGYSDIALVGNSGWAFIPVAFAAGGGTWQLTTQPAPSFNQWAAGPGVKALVGDYNKDGYTDIALTGGSGWASIPVAFSAGGGSFQITNYSVPNFGSWASGAGVKAIVGDFNRDGYSDIALTGGAGWNTLPVALAAGGGTFQINNNFVGSFGNWATWSGVRPVAGDFNGDGFTDIALTSPSFGSIPVAFSTGWASFSVTNGLATYAPSTTDANATIAVGRAN